MATTLETTVRAFLAYLDACDDYIDTGDVLDWAAQLRGALTAPVPDPGPADRRSCDTPGHAHPTVGERDACVRAARSADARSALDTVTRRPDATEES